MPHFYDQDEQIDKYLQGELAGRELAEFQDKLNRDKTFREEVDFHKSIIENLKIAGHRDWEKKLDELDKKMALDIPTLGSSKIDDKKIAKFPSRGIIYFRAAAILLVVIISGWLVNTLIFTGGTERIFTDNFEPYPVLEPNNRSIPSKQPSSETAALDAYRSREYEKSIELFKQVLAREDKDDILFYLGNAYLASNQASNAEQTFLLYLSKYQEFETESKWYLSLAYIKQKKQSQAKPLLTQLVNENNRFSERAKAILNTLDNNR